MSANKVIVITGPTSSGKTGLAISMAKEQNGEVISADSRQVYQGLDISTGKVTPEEAAGVPHHLIDIRHPNDTLTAHQWRDLAVETIKAILSRGKLPIVAGGTGFYINTLLNNTNLPNVPANPELREKLDKMSTKHLQDQLQRMDPVRFDKVDLNNRVRLIRSIEIADSLGAVPEATPDPLPYDFEVITLLPDKAELKQIIIARTKARIESGLVEEIERVHTDMGVPWARLEQLGFDQKYAAQHLQGQLSKEEMTELIIRYNWRYAKRQYTWINNQILKSK